MPKMGTRKGFPKNYQSKTQKMSRLLVRQAEDGNRKQSDRNVADRVDLVRWLVCKEASGSGVEWGGWCGIKQEGAWGWILQTW